MSSASRKIPVYLVAGFLGAGKTTFVNQLLTQAHGYKVGMVVNDFGKVNIDARLVEASVDELVSLSNGCLCCSLSNELDDSLNKLTENGRELDWIIVEASGLADPTQMIELILNSQNPRVFFQDIIYVVDLPNFKEFWRNYERQATLVFRTSKLILLNKTDLASAEEIAEVEGLIREQNPRAMLVHTTQARLDYRLLADPKTEADLQAKLVPELTEESCKHCGHQHHEHEACEHHSHEHHDSTEGFVTWSWSEAKSLDPLETTAFLNQLPSTIYRVKGWLNFGKKAPGHKLILQIVGKNHQLKAVAWEENEARQTDLVFVGREIDTTKLQADCEALIDPAPDLVTPENQVSLEYFR